MKNFASRLLLAFLFMAPLAAHAQSTGRVVTDCTTGVPLAYGVGSTSLMTMLADGRACVSAAVTASISGFTAAARGTPISASTSSATGSLPAGAVVVATNVGATNGAYCVLGAGPATTSDQYLSPGGGWFAYTVGASTQLSCITSASTTTVNMTGGAGLPTGTGGGGGSGGGGAITAASGSYAAGAFSAGVAVSGSWLDGAIVTLGAKADAHTCSSGSAIACLGQIDDDVKGSIPAGTALIGKVGIDQTAPGTTNGVQLPATQAGGVGLGQALAAASVPVVMTAAQITTLTPPTNTGYATSANQTADPCTLSTKTTKPISTSSAGPVELVALSGATKIYVCSIIAVNDTAIKLSFIDGTGGSCASAQHAIYGSTTAASGMSLAATSGFSQGNGGATVATTAAASAFCLLQSGTSLVAGTMTYVQQ